MFVVVPRQIKAHAYVALRSIERTILLSRHGTEGKNVSPVIVPLKFYLSALYGFDICFGAKQEVFADVVPCASSEVADAPHS